MTITHLATGTVIVSRMTQVSGYKQAFSTVTGVLGALQPISQQDATLRDGVGGRAYQFFCDVSADIQEGDRLRDSDGNRYRVRAGGVTKRSQGSIDFKKVVCEKL